MLFKGPLESGREMGQVALDLLARRYPAPVYGRELPENQLPPIFGFHSVRAEPFEQLLRFLAGNGYETLTCDAYLEWMRGGERPGSRRCLMLTFDDGMGQVWSVAWPLLQKYGMTAVVFLIPGVIRNGDRARPSPTLQDVWAGRASLEEVEQRDRSGEPLSTWAEIRRMHESGAIDFQAHTLSHNLVFTSSKRTGFVAPALIRSLHPNRLTMWDERRSAYRVRPPLGAPVYPSAPRMADAPRVLEDLALRAECTRHVEANGKATFFDRRDWQKELESVARNYETRGAAEARTETEDERREAIRADLTETRALIERNLPGKTVRHLAYPWGVGSRTAVEISREVGYESNHWGRVGGRLANFVGGDPFETARIGEDFVPLLPGRGRSNLRSVIRKKLEKNLRRLA